MTFTMLDMGSFAILIVPLVIFAYILLTNQDTIERTLDEKARKRIYVKGNFSKATKNMLLIGALFLIAFSLGRPAMVQKNSTDMTVIQSYALVFTPQTSEKAKTFIHETEGSIGLFLATDRLLMLSTPTASKDFLLKRIDDLDTFQINNASQTITPTSIFGLDANTTIINLADNAPYVPKTSTEESLAYEKIEELYLYPLILASALIFITLFMPRFSAPSLLLPLCFLGLLDTQSHAFFLDFYTLDQAKKQYKAGEYTQAIATYEQLSPHIHPEIDYNIANAYYKLDKYQKAVEFYFKFEAKDEKQKFDRLFNLGNTFFQLGNYEKALHFYHQAQKIKNEEAIQQNIAETTQRLNGNTEGTASTQPSAASVVKESKYKLPTIPYSENTPKR